jgi:protein-disulfide isomerase
MAAQTRNMFLIALAVIALAGVALIFTARSSNPTPTAGGADKKFTVTINGQAAEIIGKPYTGDPATNIRYSLGKPDAKITVVLFSDYQCPFCRVFTEETESQFISEFVDTGKVRFVFRDMPLQQHPNGFRAALATACANEQDRFWQLHNVIFRAQAEWSELPTEAADARFADYAGQVGIDTTQLKTCVASGKHDAAIRKDAQQATALGLDGTPTFYINGYRYGAALPLEALRAILKDAGVE